MTVRLVGGSTRPLQPLEPGGHRATSLLWVATEGVGTTEWPRGAHCI